MNERSRSAARRRILFASEAVTLAHIARPAALLAGVDAQHDVFFACAPRAARFVVIPPGQMLPIQSAASVVFGDRLRRGAPVYEASELVEYIGADLALIERVRPDLIVGDSRLSLSISARIVAVPYAGVANAYWSPYAAQRSLPLLVLPWTRFVPIPVVRQAFDLMQSRLLARHCRPLNSVCALYGLQVLQEDLRVVYTDADHTLYADSPTTFPTPGAPSNHRYLDPVIWSPPVPRPAWWNDVVDDRPTVYVTMGSSCHIALLEVVLDGLAGLALNVIASTAGSAAPSNRWPGSPTTFQGPRPLRNQFSSSATAAVRLRNRRPPQACRSWASAPTWTRC